MAWRLLTVSIESRLTTLQLPTMGVFGGGTQIIFAVAAQITALTQALTKVLRLCASDLVRLRRTSLVATISSVGLA